MRRLWSACWERYWCFLYRGLTSRTGSVLDFQKLMLRCCNKLTFSVPSPDLLDLAKSFIHVLGWFLGVVFRGSQVRKFQIELSFAVCPFHRYSMRAWEARKYSTISKPLTRSTVEATYYGLNLAPLLSTLTTLPHILPGWHVARNSNSEFRSLDLANFNDHSNSLRLCTISTP